MSKHPDDIGEAKAAALAQALKNMREIMDTPLHRELNTMKARIAFREFSDLMMAGFSEEQALKLCQKGG